MLEIRKGTLPIKSWADDLEEGALQQAINLSNLPFAFSHISLMPDVHQGYGMPIGGVLATKEKLIVPNAVGVDIGCGVTALQTDISHISADKISTVLQKAKELIPVGFKHHKKPQRWEGFNTTPNSPVVREQLKSAKHQLCTLGGGNHFCSIEKGSDNHIWLMVHSGSRNIGYKVAAYYNKIAKKLNKNADIVPRSFDLAPLSLLTAEGAEYFDAMNYCLSFAKANREALISQFLQIFARVTGASEIQIIDCHHNFAAQETHFNEEVIIHRKGAIKATAGQLGIIPGSMGTSSYIVQGLGNPDSFNSSSHGAGRIMSRKEANKTITEESANRAMEGIIFDDWQNDYAEAPMAYKDIEKVIVQQNNLVKPIIKLTPLGVMKG